MLSSDIICLQEFWFDPSYETIFRSALEDAYEFHTLKRTGGKSDGVAVLLRRGKWDVRSSLGMSLSSVGDRVALVMHLRSQDGTSQAVGGGEEDMILVNTHLAFPHTSFDRANQMAQIEVVTDTVEGFVRNSGLPTMTPRVVVGDLNVEETDPVCRHLGSNGFRSAFASLHREQRVITHRNHRGEEVRRTALLYYCVCVCVLGNMKLFVLLIYRESSSTSEFGALMLPSQEREVQYVFRGRRGYGRQQRQLQVLVTNTRRGKTTKNV